MSHVLNIGMTHNSGKHSKKEGNSRKTEYERRVLNARIKNYDEKVGKRKECERKEEGKDI